VGGRCLIDVGEIGSGLGGFRKALENIGGFNFVWSCDFDKWANRVYLKHWPKSDHHPADVRGVDPEEIPDFDLLCSGFPCQPFSNAGKRQGFEDTRGTIFFEILRIAAVKKPKMLFLENVDGIRWHDGGRTLTKILLRLRELGYTVGYQTFNSRFHGVAQDRARCFIIAVLRDGGPRQILPILEDDRVSDEIREDKKLVSIAQSLRGRDYQNWRGNFVIAPENAATLTAGGHSAGLNTYMTLILDPFNKRIRGDGVAGALKTANSAGSTGTVVAITATNPRESGGERVWRFTDIARTLTQPWGNQHTIIVDWLTGKLRRLTPREEERLQGLPDDWTLRGVNEKGKDVKMSDSQRYRLLGQAVTVNVVEVIGRHIKAAFEA